MQRFPGVTQAKAALMKHIPRLVLTPRQTAEGPVFEVSGSLNLAAGEEYVMPAVAWDGIGWHYTALTLPVAGVALNPRV